MKRESLVIKKSQSIIFHGMYYKLILLPSGWWSHSNRRWRTCRRWSQIVRASSGAEPSLSADRASTWLAVSSGAYSTNIQYFDFTIIPRSSFTFHPSHVLLYVSLFTTHSPTVRDTFFTPLSKLAIEEWGKSFANRVYTLIYTSSIDLSNFFRYYKKRTRVDMKFVYVRYKAYCKFIGSASFYCLVLIKVVAILYSPLVQGLLLGHSTMACLRRGCVN